MDWFIYGYLLNLCIAAVISLPFVIVSVLILALVWIDLKKFGIKETLLDLIGGGRNIE